MRLCRNLKISDSIDRLEEALMYANKATLKAKSLSIIERISKWEWKMSALGFFTVDQTVMGGVRFTH